MSISIRDYQNEIAEQIQATDLEIESCRDQKSGLPDDLAQLTGERTEAFVELAQVYLPELTHAAIAHTWHEVRAEIRQVLLLKDDENRQLQTQLAESIEDFERISRDLLNARTELQKARRDLASKRGNLEKALRDDPQIQRLSKQIDRVDADIEIGLRKLERVSEEANEKLPDYEACHLFEYLRERKFGTPDYNQSAIERRWDRWIARLIDYRDASKSYHHLVKTPVAISQLIDEKQRSYRSLLSELERVRADAIAVYGIEQQEKLIEQARQSVKSFEHELQKVSVAKRSWERQLEGREGIQGEYYHRAIEIYARFLATIEPETLAVYAACTETPIDDEIGARIRDFDERIAAAKAADQELGHLVSGLRRYRMALKTLERKIGGEFDSGATYRMIDGTMPLFTQYLERLRQETITVSEVIVEIRDRIATSQLALIQDEVPVRTDDTIEATFRAAVTELRSLTSPTPETLGEEPEEPNGFVDPVGILVHPSGSATFRTPNSKYTKLAVCHREANSNYIIQLLAKHQIDCFPTQAGRLPMPQRMPIDAEGTTEDWLDVMVVSDRFDEARDLVLDALAAFDHPWQCQSCDENIPKGFDMCWNCGCIRPEPV